MKALTRLLAVVLVFCLPGCPKEKKEQARREPKPNAAAKAPERRAEPKNPYELEQVSEARQGLDKVRIFKVPGLGDGLYTEDWIRIKVITKRRGIVCMKTAGGALNGNELEFFWPYYVMEAYPQGKDKNDYRSAECFLLSTGTTKASSLGWVRAEDVEIWPTRMGVRIRLLQLAGRDVPFNFYASREDLVKLITGQPTNDPIAGVRKLEHFTFMPLVVLDSEVIKHDGRSHEIFKVAFLGEVRKGAAITGRPLDTVKAPPKADEKKKLRLLAGTKKLYLVFVMDTTGSTTPYIEAMKQAVSYIVTKVWGITKFKPEVHVRLVEYRDYVSGLGFVTKPHPVHTDLNSFLAEVGGVKAAVPSSVDFPEAVFDGLYTALYDSDWGEDISMKAVVLIGDDSGHLPGSTKNPNSISMENIIGFAKGKDIRIYSICAPCRGGDDEKKRHYAQFSALAAETGGECCRLDDSSKTAESIAKVLEKQSYWVQANVKAGEGFAEGKSTEDIKQTFLRVGIPLKYYAPIIEFYDKHGFARQLSPGVPTYSTGWVLGNLGDTVMVEKEVYCFKLELNFLLRELFGMKCGMESNDPMALLGMVVDVKAGELRKGEIISYWNTSDPAAQIVYYKVHGLPVPTDRVSIMRHTKEELVHMDQDSKTDLMRNIGTAVDRLQTDMNNKRRFPFERLPGWIREGSLP